MQTFTGITAHLLYDLHLNAEQLTYLWSNYAPDIDLLAEAIYDNVIYEAHQNPEPLLKRINYTPLNNPGEEYYWSEIEEVIINDVEENIYTIITAVFQQAGWQQIDPNKTRIETFPGNLDKDHDTLIFTKPLQ